MHWTSARFDRHVVSYFVVIFSSLILYKVIKFLLNFFLFSEGKTTFGSEKTFLGLGKRFFP